MRQLNREEGKIILATPFLSLPVVPHVGETDSDTLTEIPDRLVLHDNGPDDEEEDEYGYSWSESHNTTCVMYLHIFVISHWQ